MQEDFEVSLVRLPATVHEITFPLCLVVACVARNASVRPRAGGIPAWPLQQVPRAMAQCSVDVPSGQIVFPFADSPHITQEGFILHGSNERTELESTASFCNEK